MKQKQKQTRSKCAEPFCIFRFPVFFFVWCAFTSSHIIMSMNQRPCFDIAVISHGPFDLEDVAPPASVRPLLASFNPNSSLFRNACRDGGFGPGGVRMPVNTIVPLQTLTLHQLARCVNVICWNNVMHIPWLEQQVQLLTSEAMVWLWKNNGWVGLGNVAYISLHCSSEVLRTKCGQFLAEINETWWLDRSTYP